ncbi:MAG TPA: glycoside hydrolase family 43 protein [Acidimicrobiia bacterium]|nr:glycoside hydrolase family 43 protein [Acidimicrobiia bacterium]
MTIDAPTPGPPGRRGPAGPATRRWRRLNSPRWRRGIVVAAVVAVVAAQSALAWTRWESHRALGDTREDLTVAAATRAELRESLAATDIEVGSTYGTLTVRTVERDETATVLSRAQDDLVSTNVLRYETGGRAAETERHIATLDACLGGVKRAISTVDAGAAVPELRAAQPACTEVLVAGTGAVFPFDFPDPFVLRVGGTYFAFSTNAGAGDVQVIVSTDLIRWTIVGNALAGLPQWAAAGATWAPAVLPVTGGYAMYYTAHERASGRQCISRATSRTPYGPYVDGSSGPMVCQHGLGGSIDPSPFLGPDGNRTLLWKSEQPAEIWSQPLAADGTLTGRPSRLLAVDQSWERGVIEAPSMIFGDGGFTLLYSGNRWDSREYATGAARCATPAGPCLKLSSRPILAGYDHVLGPGGATPFTAVNGQSFLAYAAYHDPHVGYPASRLLHLATIDLGASPPVVTPIP